MFFIGTGSYEGDLLLALVLAGILIFALFNDKKEHREIREPQKIERVCE